ncbi:TPA: hypothetical protein ACH3X2_000299 [Trebouxia sp. C0005]
MPRISGGAVNTKNMKMLFGRPRTHSVQAKPSCTSTQLIGNKLHSWHGMLGYCQKHKLKKHFQVIKSGDITNDDLSVHCEVFCCYGNGDLKTKLSSVSNFPSLQHFSVNFPSLHRAHFLQNGGECLCRCACISVQEGVKTPQHVCYDAMF